MMGVAETRVAVWPPEACLHVRVESFAWQYVRIGEMAREAFEETVHGPLCYTDGAGRYCHFSGWRVVMFAGRVL